MPNHRVPRTHAPALLPILLAVLFFLAATSAVAQAPIKILFWGGTATSTHNAHALRDTLAPVFAANNMTPYYRETASHSWLNADSLAQFDVALLYTTDQTGTDLSAQQLTAFTNWIAAGHVVVALHGSTNTYLNNGAVSTSWRQLLGAQFLDHDTPNNCGTISFTQPGHAALTGTTTLPPSGAATGSPPFWDEGRRHTSFVSDTVVIARAQLGTTNAPWIWVRPQGSGWVYYNASGHNGEVWTRPEWKGQVIRALQWGNTIKTTGIRGPSALGALRSILSFQGNTLAIPFHTPYRLEISDLQGRSILSRGHATAPSQDLGFLSAGSYEVRLFPEGSEPQQGRIVKAR